MKGYVSSLTALKSSGVDLFCAVSSQKSCQWLIIASLPVGECVERPRFLLGQEKGQRLKGPGQSLPLVVNHFQLLETTLPHYRPHMCMATAITSDLALVGQSGVPFGFTRAADFSILTKKSNHMPQFCKLVACGLFVCLFFQESQYVFNTNSFSL